jgi:hypothetical protein
MDTETDRTVTIILLQKKTREMFAGILDNTGITQKKYHTNKNYAINENMAFTAVFPWRFTQDGK